MGRVVAKRVTAVIEGDFDVFLIGMRINRLGRAGLTETQKPGIHPGGKELPSHGKTEEIPR